MRPPGEGMFAGKRIVDLSAPIEESSLDAFPTRIRRLGHVEGADHLGWVAATLKLRPFRERVKALARYVAGDRIGRRTLPDGEFLGMEVVTAPVHSGTHLDAPFHYGRTSEGRPARKIGEVPLEWCCGPGVVVDVRHLPPGSAVTASVVEEIISHIPGGIVPGAIVLFLTGVDRYRGTREYYFRYPGISVAAIDWLLDRGIKLMGTDAPSFDPPFGRMIAEYERTRDAGVLWPAHIHGRRREYFHIEKLAHVDRLPPAGFEVACFPVLVEGAGAGWVRAVAFVEDRAGAQAR